MWEQDKMKFHTLVLSAESVLNFQEACPIIAYVTHSLLDTTLGNIIRDCKENGVWVFIDDTA